MMAMTTLDYLLVLSMTLTAYISANRRKIIKRLIPDKKGGAICLEKETLGNKAEQPLD